MKEFFKKYKILLLVALLVFGVLFFKILRTKLGGGYFISNNKVFYKSKMFFSDAIEIKEADPDTFEILQKDYFWGGYTKDDDNIFYDGDSIIGADVETFKILYGYVYSRDKNNVYANGVMLKNVDLNTFEVIEIDNTDYVAKDKNHIYLYNEIILEDDGVNPEKFIYLGDDYFGDGKNIWFDWDGDYLNKIESDVDMETFEILGEYYAKDKNNCYRVGRIVDKSKCDKF